MNFLPKKQRLVRPAIAALIALFGLALGATAGSLTPPALPASTMRTLQEIYDSIASSGFDSSAIGADQNGSLIEHLKYIEANMNTSGVSSDSLDFDEFADNMTLDGTTTVAMGGFNYAFTGTGNVGIGTSNPLYKLSVAGTASVSGGFFGSGLSTCSGGSFLQYDSTTGLFSCAASGAGAGGWTDDGTVVRLTTTSDNVGIGTVTPAAKLNVVTSGSVETLRLTNASTANGGAGAGEEHYIGFANNGGTFARIAGFSGGATSGFLTFYTKSGGTLAERMRIDNTGGVGIGTTNPLFKLAVAGTASVSGGFFGSGLVDCDTGATSKLLWDATTGMFSCGSDQTGGGAGGWTDDGTVVRLTTASDNVGIGTATPETQLHLVGPTASGAGPAIQFNNTDFGVQGVENRFAIDQDGFGNGRLILGGGTMWMQMLNRGKFNFGNFNLNPDSFFQVASATASIGIRSTGATSSASLNFYPANNAVESRFTIRAGGLGGNSERLDFINGAGANLVTIASAGNVGIGTTTPGVSSGISGIDMVNAGNYVGIRLRATRPGAAFNKSWQIFNDTFSGNLAFRNEDIGGEPLDLTPTNTVKIGTTLAALSGSILTVGSQSATLSIKSTDAAASTSIVLLPNNGATGNKFRLLAGGGTGAGEERLDILNGSDTRLFSIASNGFARLGPTTLFQVSPYASVSLILGAQNIGGSSALLGYSQISLGRIISNITIANPLFNVVGQYLFHNAALTGPDKRIGSITGYVDPAHIASGGMSFWTQRREGIIEQHMVISPMGNIGIGTGNTVTTKLQVLGLPTTGDDRYLCATNATGAFIIKNAACSTSSLRFKENIRPIEYGLEDVMRLNPVEFNYKTDIGGGRTRDRLGLIAEEVNPIIPEVVLLDAEGRPDSVDYPSIIALNIKAIQELNDRIDSLDTDGPVKLRRDSESDSWLGLSFSKLFAKIIDKFDSMLGIEFDERGIQTEQGTFERICLDDTCISEKQLRQILQNLE